MVTSVLHLIDSLFRVLPDCNAVDQDPATVYGAVAIHLTLIALAYQSTVCPPSSCRPSPPPDPSLVFS